MEGKKNEIIEIIEEKLFGAIGNITTLRGENKEKELEKQIENLAKKYGGNKKDNDYLLQKGEGEFKIRHYAGIIKYKLSKMIEKNSSKLENKLKKLMTNPLIDKFKIKYVNNIVKNFKFQLNKLISELR